MKPETQDAAELRKRGRRKVLVGLLLFLLAMLLFTTTLLSRLGSP